MLDNAYISHYAEVSFAEFSAKHSGERQMPALGTRHPADYQLLDSTGQRKGFQIFYGPVTALTIAGLLTELGTLTGTVDDLTIGTLAKSQFTIDENIISNTVPSDQAAQVGSNLLVMYQDATTEAPYSFNIPTIDYSKLNFVDGGGNAVIFAGAGASAEVAAFVTAFEAVAKAPATGNAVHITGMKYNSKRE
jgi:hypothetical protein